MKNKLLKAIYMLSRYFLYGFVIQLLFLNFGLPTKAKGQYKSIEEVTVVISHQQMTLGGFFEEVQSQTAFVFSYDSKKIDRMTGLVFGRTKGSVEDFLMDISQQHPLSFRQLNNSIDVKKAEGKPVEIASAEDPIKITGTVTDENGNPIPGVTVSVPGTGTGTATDLEGRYALEVPEESTLVFSFIGFVTQNIAIGGRNVVDVVLSEDMASLEEVVVVGYGTQRRSEVTGSVGVVSGEELREQPSFNAMQSLRGKVPGVNIYTNSGAPTGNNRVVIRGVGTINASSDPLYVVDGLVMDNIDVMNPNDIKSIEVLKDASATAIYGARGANGVILITTERGGTGEGVTVGYRFDFSISKMRKKMDVMNAQEFMEVQRIGYENAPKFNEYPQGGEPVIDLSDTKLFDAQGNPLYDTDWQEEATRTALSQNHQLSVQSSGEKSSFGAFLNYTDRQGIVLNSWMKRANVKLVYDAKPKEWLSIGTNMTVNRSWENNVVETGGGSSFGRGVVEMPPIFPVKWPDGTWANSTQSAGLSFEGMANPVHKALEEDRLRDRNQLFGNTYVAFHITPHLEIRTQLGINNVQYDSRDYLPTDMIGGFPTGYAGTSNSETTYWQNENFLTYLQEIGPHRINSVLGASWQQRSYRNRAVSVRGFSDDFFRYNNLGTATTPSAPTSTANEWTMNSYFTRLNYTYNNKYSATLTGRVDGSSRFGSNSKYGVFPSAGVAWLVSNEDFMSGVKFIDHLRLRTSYGVTGNTEIGLFQSLATIGFGTTLIGGSRQTSSFVQRLPNPDLEWEKTYQYNIGFELNMFQDIVSLEADYYHKLTNDLLLERPIPTTSGFGLIMDNIGSVSNQGLDFMITTRNLRTGSFLWSTTLNFNYNKNRVESLGVNDEDIFPGPFHFDGSNTILRVGEPISSFWGFERLGIWGTEEAEEAREVGKLPGMIKRSEEKQILGKGLPDWSGSFINRFNLGNFDLTMDLQFVYGVQVEQGFLLTAEDRQALVNGLTTQLYEGWTENNQDAMVPQIRHTVLSGQDLARDSRWIANGSYLRGNLFSVGYTFDQESLNSLGMGSFRITANVENAFVIHSSEFLGYDPEGTGYIGNQFGQNTFFYQYPKPRTFTIGFNVQF